MSTARVYDLVVLGASGYTGKLTAEFIAQNFPTDIRWAIAGRSRHKLKEVATECKSLNPDRSQPGKYSRKIKLNYDGATAHVLWFVDLSM